MSGLMTGYGILQFAWWVIMVVIFMAFLLTAGGDIGVGFLLPFVAKNDVERRVTLNAIGPTWEGNQTWFVLAGGAMFAVWPELYAGLFSGFYAVIIALLFALFLRPVCFDYRNKIQHTRWRFTWDWVMCLACCIALLIIGIAPGNMYLGVPFHFIPDEMRFEYTGCFWGLIRPFPILIGLLVLSVLSMHGASILAIKSEGSVRDKARQYGFASAIISFILFIATFLWLSQLQGFQIDHMDPHHAMPIFAKHVSLVSGAWLHNYFQYPILFVFPILAVIALMLNIFAVKRLCDRLSLFAASLIIIGITMTFAIALFPFLMPSSTYLVHSLTVWDASSSFYTLVCVLVVGVIMLPVIIAYTIWIYWVMRGRVSEKMIEKNSATLY